MGVNIPLPSGRGTLWPTIVFPMPYRLFFLPLPHIFLTALLQRLEQLTVRLRGGAMVSRTNSLVATA